MSGVDPIVQSRQTSRYYCRAAALLAELVAGGVPSTTVGALPKLPPGEGRRSSRFFFPVSVGESYPEVLLRLLVVGYLYGITSERRLLEEVRMHLASRWFAGLRFDRELPDHSTFSKNRHVGFARRACFVTCSRRWRDAASPRGWSRAGT